MTPPHTLFQEDAGRIPGSRILPAQPPLRVFTQRSRSPSPSTTPVTPVSPMSPSRSGTPGPGLQDVTGAPHPGSKARWGEGGGRGGRALTSARRPSSAAAIGLWAGQGGSGGGKGTVAGHLDGVADTQTCVCAAATTTPAPFLSGTSIRTRTDHGVAKMTASEGRKSRPVVMCTHGVALTLGLHWLNCTAFRRGAAFSGKCSSQFSKGLV